MRDGYGVAASALITALVFGGAPICAMSLGLVRVYDVAVLASVAADDRAAVVLALPAIEAVLLDTVDEEGAPTDEAPAAGPDPIDDTDPLAGPGDAIADASGGGQAADAAPEAEAVLPVAPQGRVITRPTEVGGASLRARAKPRLDSVKGYTQYAKDYVLGRSNVRPARCKDTHEDVEKAGAGRWDVDRELVEYYTSSIARFNSLGWSGPYNEDDLKGWKIGGFGCNSPLYHAGLRRGDIILTVNDRPTRTWLQVFGAYRKLKKHDDFEVVLVRRGKQKTLRYSLVET